MSQYRPTPQDLEHPWPAETAGMALLRYGALMGLYWLAVFVLYSYQGYFHDWLATFLVMDSEYTVPEQLSKFTLFLGLLAGVVAYSRSRTGREVKTGIAYIALTLVMYMAESNELKEEAQPLFGLVFGGLVLSHLWRWRRWLSMAYLATGFSLIAAAAFIDQGLEHAYIRNLWPGLFAILERYTGEETLELVGNACLGLSALLCFAPHLTRFARANPVSTVLILICAGLLTCGNGFIHQQYNPGSQRHTCALAMMLAGFLGLMIINRKILDEADRFRLGSASIFHLVLFTFFVALPSHFGRERLSGSLLVWLPLVAFLAHLAWRHHPLARTRQPA